VVAPAAGTVVQCHEQTISINSSARARRDVGIVRPSAFAVFILMTSALHPLASLPELCLLLRRQILPVFELLKCILGIGARRLFGPYYYTHS
jgi:hypothetical protein